MGLPSSPNSGARPTTRSTGSVNTIPVAGAARFPMISCINAITESTLSRGTTLKIILFCGRIDSRNAGGVYGLIEEHEDIEVQVLSYADAMRFIDSGEINNAMTIIALQWLQLHRQELLDSWN